MEKGIIIGLVIGIIVIIVVIVAIAVYCYKRWHKEQNGSIGNETGSEKNEPYGIENCTNNKQEDDYEGESYAVFKISDEAAQNPHEADQEDAEFSEYNHLHEIFDKPELDNTYDVPQSRGETVYNETSHFNSMCKVNQRLASGNEYGMSVTKAKPKHESAVNVYENASVSYEPVLLQDGRVQFS